MPGNAWAAKEPHWAGVKTAIEEAHLTDWMEGRLGAYTSEDGEGDDRPLWKLHRETALAPYTRHLISFWK
jgi:hypothetical protein